MKRNRQTLEVQFGDIYTVATNIGHVLLIGNNTTTETFTTNYTSESDRVIIAANTVYGDGARVRFSTTGTLPAPLTSGVDYWVTPDGGDSTKLFVYDSFANWVASTEIVLTSDGSGTHTLVEQEFSEAAFLDGNIPFSAIANKEITHADYARLDYNYPTVLWDSTNKAAYGTATFTYTRNPINPTIDFRFVALAIGSSSTIGDFATGSIDSLHDFVTPQSITTAQAINLRVELKG
jgi:hypothetical protein